MWFVVPSLLVGLSFADGVSELAPDTCASDDPLDGITWEEALTNGRTRFGCKNGMGWEDTCEAPCACRKLCMANMDCNYYAGTKVSGCFFFEFCDSQNDTPNYSQKLQTWHKLCPDPTPPPTEPPTEPPVAPPTEAPVDPTAAPTDPPTDPPVDPTMAPTDPPTEPPVDPTMAPTDPPTEPPVDPTMAPTDPPTEPPVDPTMAPTDPPTEPPVDPTMAPTDPPTEPPVEPPVVCGDITDACLCTGECGWSSTDDMCEEGKTTTCMECPTMEGCDASNCVPAGKCGQYDAMRVCQCTSDCAEHDNCCPDVGECGNDETCHPLTHKDCKQNDPPGCWWQFDTKECITYDELAAKIKARPCTENRSFFQCEQNSPPCGFYFGDGNNTGQCMDADDIPCDNAKTKYNCNKRAPTRRPDGKFANRTTTKKIRCLWDDFHGKCMPASGGPRPCDTLLLKAPCESQAARGCVWDGVCHEEGETKNGEGGGGGSQ